MDKNRREAAPPRNGWDIHADGIALDTVRKYGSKSQMKLQGTSKPFRRTTVRKWIGIVHTRRTPI